MRIIETIQFEEEEWRQYLKPLEPWMSVAQSEQFDEEVGKALASVVRQRDPLTHGKLVAADEAWCRIGNVLIHRAADCYDAAKRLRAAARGDGTGSPPAALREVGTVAGGPVPLIMMTPEQWEGMAVNLERAIERIGEATQLLRYAASCVRPIPRTSESDENTPPDGVRLLR